MIRLFFISGFPKLLRGRRSGRYRLPFPVTCFYIRVISGWLGAIVPIVFRIPRNRRLRLFFDVYRRLRRNGNHGGRVPVIGIIRVAVIGIGVIRIIAITERNTEIESRSKPASASITAVITTTRGMMVMMASPTPAMKPVKMSRSARE